MKKIFAGSLLLLVLFIINSCDQSPQGQTSRQTVQNNHPINTDAYWRTEGYQIFSKYDLAIKAPVKLKDVNRQSQGNFDMHYAEFDGNRRTHKGTYYEILAFKIPDYSQYSGVSQLEYERDFLNTHMDRQGGTDYTANIQGGRLYGKVLSYREQGRNAKAFSFVRNGNLISLNVISDNAVGPLFEKYLNSMVFYKDLEPAEDTDETNQPAPSSNNIKPQVSRNENLQYYDNSTHNFSIGYPKNWKQVNFQGVIFAAVDDRTNNSLNVVVMPNERRSLEAVTRANISELKRNLPSLELVNESSGTVNNKRFTSTLSSVYNPTIQARQYIKTYCFVEKGKAYIITFGSMGSFSGSFNTEVNEIIESFHVL